MQEQCNQFTMAKFKSSTFGKISGKHGDVVAVTMKDGTTYFRTYIIPPNPNTVKQQSQRGKFGFVVKELNCMRKLFTVTFGGQYGINRAVSLAMKTCVSGEFPDFRIDFSRLQIAVGNLPVPEFLSLEKLSTNSLKLNWSYNELKFENPDDTISVVLFNEVKKQIIHLQNIAFRRDKDVLISVPELILNTEVYMWMYISSEKNNLFSESRFLGLRTF